jgi:hypothetical protein
MNSVDGLNMTHPMDQSVKGPKVLWFAVGVPAEKRPPTIITAAISLAIAAS